MENRALENDLDEHYYMLVSLDVSFYTDYDGNSFMKIYETEYRYNYLNDLILDYIELSKSFEIVFV